MNELALCSCGRSWGNDVGLLTEEYDAKHERMVGNFLQVVAPPAAASRAEP